MGSGVPRGARPPSHVAYYVALAGILGLLVLLCCYFFYYFINKVKELSQQETPLQTPTSRAPPAPVAAYPVQPVVRDSATAMARLCKQLPAPAPKGDTVFPKSTSPAALRTDTGEAPHHPVPAPGPEKVPVPGPEKVPVPGPEKVPVSGPKKVPVPGPEKVPVSGPEKVPVPGPEKVPVPAAATVLETAAAR